MTWSWHSPALYELALALPQWHYLQHVSFLVAGLLFWFPVIRPYPFRPSWPLWQLLPYLILADLSNTLLSALLTFSDRVLYSHYATIPPISGGTALEDQSTAGVLMWVPGSLVYLLPLAGITVNLLSGERSPGALNVQSRAAERRNSQPPSRAPMLVDGRFPLPLAGYPQPSSRFDLLGVPVIGRVLLWRYSRLLLQIPMLAVAVAVIVDGFVGPDVAPMNLAGVLIWVIWRGLLMLALLIGGNFSSAACPFLLPRTIARKIPACRDAAGRDCCGGSGWHLVFWWYSSPPTRRLPSGTIRG